MPSKFYCPWHESKRCFNPWHHLKLIIAGFHPLSGCWFGAHRWYPPGGHCERCGKCDEFFQCTPLTDAEAEREYDNAEPVPMSDEDIERYVRIVEGNAQ